MPQAPPDADALDISAKVRRIRRAIREEYLRPHARPWIVGFSGGKDSTLLLHLVVEALLDIAPDRRTRPVYVLSNDTRVESPVYQASVEQTLGRVRDGVAALGLPITVVQTHPDPEQSFWVNLLGRGYPAPNRSFRWCTDRMKIRPTTKFIHDQVCAAGEVVLLLGVRSAESQARARRIAAYDEQSAGERLSPHNDVKGCLIFRPIVDLTNDEVWVLLLSLRPPWGGTHRELMALYRNAGGGECPFVLDEAASASCGSTSARFGCWTCTVVEKDNSLDGLIDAGFEHLEPLGAFRRRLREVSETPAYRSKTRRDGRPGLGPLTFEARQLLLDELLAVQQDVRLPLISEHEVRLIRDWWHRDEATATLREVDRLVSLTVEGS